ncbi:MAG: endonuclease V [Micrococcales bacterium]|nr:endonuclease V [Micrococcales bacterium]
MDLFKRLEAEQTRLAQGIDLVNQVDVEDLRLVAGVDTAYWTSEDGVERGACCVVVVDYRTHEVIQTVTTVGQPTVPYLPGLLAFRELPLLEEAIAQLNMPPDLFLFDGNGILHPRRMGIATQASFLVDRPTVGVAKTYYRVGDADYKSPADEFGAISKIAADEEVLGAAVRTRKGVKPVFVSVGNWIDLNTAVTVTLSLVEKASRLPVPLREADLATHRARRHAQNDSR